jgi:hypothetical protein
MKVRVITRGAPPKGSETPAAYWWDVDLPVRTFAAATLLIQKHGVIVPADKIRAAWGDDSGIGDCRNGAVWFPSHQIVQVMEL